MTILIAPDSFKGALAAPQVAEAISIGLRRVFPSAQTALLPVADGGEGTAQALCTATRGRLITQVVRGPLGNPIPAQWSLLGDEKTAVVELAQAAGLTLLSPKQRDPKLTTTYGVGELLQTAVHFPGVERVIIALGGSATNDGGAGILQAFGVKLLDSTGNELPPGGAALQNLARIDFTDTRNRLQKVYDSVEIQIACDVDNPLTGERGASAVFGPQKGASPADVLLLDSALTRYAALLAESGRDVSIIPGSGAAGGAAAGLLYLFPNAKLHPGIDIVLDSIGFDTYLETANLVITGEGRLDTQTLGGKVVAGVARRAMRQGVPVAAIVGGIGEGTDETLLAEQYGVRAVLALPPYPVRLETSIARTAEWLADAAARAARWILIGQSLAGGDGD